MKSACLLTYLHESEFLVGSMFCRLKESHQCKNASTTCYFHNITYISLNSVYSRKETTIRPRDGSQTIRPRTNSFFEIWIIYLRLGFGVFGFWARCDFWGGMVTDSTRGLVDWSLRLAYSHPFCLRLTQLPHQKWTIWVRNAWDFCPIFTSLIYVIIEPKIAPFPISSNCPSMRLASLWSLMLSICILVWPKYLHSSSLSKQRFSCISFKISNHGI